jgi:hypothetical protein
MLTYTQSLQSLTLSCSDGPYKDAPLEDIAVAAVSSGLKKNSTLRELTLKFAREATNTSTILTSLRSHPLLHRLYLKGVGAKLTGLETVLLSRTSKITELEIDGTVPGDPSMIGLPRVLQALARHATLTKLVLRRHLGHEEARLLRLALCSMPSLQSLDLASSRLQSAGLAELAPAFYGNTSVRVLDISNNDLRDMASAEILRDILRSNKTITTLNLYGNLFGLTNGIVECIADGLGSNSTLLKIDLSRCALRDDGVYILARALGSRNMTLQRLDLGYNCITSAGVGILLEAMETNCHIIDLALGHNRHITDLALGHNPIENEGASLLASSLGNNALPKLTHLSLLHCGIKDDGFITLISALKRNTSLLHLDLRHNFGISERTFVALAESLPEIKVLQRVDFYGCTDLLPAMPLLLAGLRKNTSLFRFHVTDCARYQASGWVQKVERLGYRNCFLPLLRAPKERLPPLGVWPHALARVTILPDVIFEVLLSKPNLVPSKDAEGKEAAEDTGAPNKRKRGDQ